VTTAGSAAPRIPALDGLRALAVLAVIAFHADLTWARGGFLGVDAFFVLSGFVITRTMLDEHRRRGAVDLARFWSRRLARLLPALILVVVGLAGYLLLVRRTPPESFRADSVAALLYVSNWRFLAAGDGYFASTADPSLLQHTWSLAIEEQFYVVWPLVVVGALRRARPRRALLVLATAAARPICRMADAAGAGESRLYFGSDTRAQSLLIGSALAVVLLPDRPLVMARRARGALHALAVAGLAGTALLWWRADGDAPWLYRGGITAAALATALVIPSVAVLPGGMVARALGLGPLRGLGRISYGVYLWHWPVQLLLTRSATGLAGLALLGLRLVTTLALAAASYRLVELPIRQRRRPPLPRIVSFAALSVGLSGVIAIAAAPEVRPRDDGVAAAAEIASTATTTPEPVVPLIELPTTTVAATVPRSTAPPTTAPPTTPKPLSPTYRVAVLGDSVAQSLARGLQPLRRQYGLAVLDDAILGCGVAASGAYRLAGVERGLADECAAWEQVWTDRVRRDRPDAVVVQLGRHEVLDRERDGEWTNILEPEFAAYVSDQVELSLEVAGRGGGAVLVLTAPFFRRSERPDGGQFPENDPARVRRFNAILREVVARYPSVRLVDLGARTNPSDRFAASVDGVQMRRDGVHYTAAACAWFAPWLVPQIREAAAARR